MGRVSKGGEVAGYIKFVFVASSDHGQGVGGDGILREQLRPKTAFIEYKLVDHPVYRA